MKDLKPEIKRYLYDNDNSMLTSGNVFVTVFVTLTFLVDFDCVVVFPEDEDIVKNFLC